MLTRNQIRSRMQHQENTAGKRKAGDSPLEKNVKKRSAFGDLTNALKNVRISSAEKFIAAKSVINAEVENDTKSGGKKKAVKNVKIVKKSNVATRIRKAHLHLQSKNSKSLGSMPELDAAELGTLKDTLDQLCGPYHDKSVQQQEQDAEDVKAVSLPNSQMNHSSPDAMSVLEDTNAESQVVVDNTDVSLTSLKLSPAAGSDVIVLPLHDPAPDYDYDKDNDLDPFNVPEFARDIFAYYMKREAAFMVPDYIPQQGNVTKQMRAILVDWMVEIQETFELNHETLYQAVKMSDLYLSRRSVDKKNLQLVGTTALFISSKFDERCPPPSEDFLYICDDAYDRQQLLHTERDMLIALGFDIGFPLSYRFLRRYGKVTKLCMKTLTLARYILESSMLFYDLLQSKDSLIAAAALLLALRMKNEGDWTNIHEKYSGYTKSDVEPVMWLLNEKMRTISTNASGRNLSSIKTKYSDEVFFKVTEIPLLSNENQQFSTPQSAAQVKPSIHVDDAFIGNVQISPDIFVDCQQ